MKKFFLVFLVLLFLRSFGNCYQVQKGSGTYSIVSIPAPSLVNNLIGTATIQEIGVYLPPSYQSSNKSYPVVYYLLGHATKVEKYDSQIFEVMEHHTVQEMILVVISGYNFYKGSMYANSPIIGNWEDYVTRDVISYMDQNFRTISNSSSRGLIGHSMGGLGVFNISLKYPDLFSSIHLMSPAISHGDDIINWVFPNDSTIQSLNHLNHLIKTQSQGEYRDRILEGIQEVGDLWLILGVGAAYSPDTKQPLLMELPILVKDNGTIVKNERVMNLWRGGLANLSQKVEENKESLMSYTYYGMDVGYEDQLGFIVSAVKALATYLEENKVPYTVFFYPGDHVNKLSENLKNRIMPQMSLSLQGQKK